MVYGVTKNQTQLSTVLYIYRPKNSANESREGNVEVQNLVSQYNVLLKCWGKYSPGDS